MLTAGLLDALCASMCSGSLALLAPAGDRGDHLVRDICAREVKAVGLLCLLAAVAVLARLGALPVSGAAQVGVLTLEGGDAAPKGLRRVWVGGRLFECSRFGIV